MIWLYYARVCRMKQYNIDFFLIFKGIVLVKPLSEHAAEPSQSKTKKNMGPALLSRGIFISNFNESDLVINDLK